MKHLYISVVFLFSIFSPAFAQENKIVCDDGSILSLTNNSLAKNNPPGVSPMACTSGSNLVTIYGTNNAQRGHMFDIDAINCVTILCFEMNLNVGTSNIDIYTKTGTHVGFENTPGAWTLIGTAPNVTSLGVNAATPIPLAINQLIAAGATRAFYITRTTAAGPTVAYTNGTAVGTALATDANMIIREGTGKELLFSTNFVPRRFNGRVFYSVNPPCVLPIELSEFNVKQNGNTVDLNWTTASEKDNAYFVIEKSVDGKSFETVKNVTGAGNSSSIKKYNETDASPINGISYYRLKQVDFNGQSTYSELRSVSVKNTGKTFVVVSPSPAQNSINIEFNTDPGFISTLEISDITGKIVSSSSITSEKEFTKTEVDVTGLNRGMYFVTLNGNNTSERVKFIKD